MPQKLEISKFFKNYSKVELGYVTTIQSDLFVFPSEYDKQTAPFQVEPDAEGVTPLRLAALYGKDNIIQYFGSGKFIDHAKPEIAFNIEKEDIVESIELMGCWYVDRKKGKGSINI